MILLLELVTAAFCLCLCWTLQELLSGGASTSGRSEQTDWGCVPLPTRAGLLSPVAFTGWSGYNWPWWPLRGIFSPQCRRVVVVVVGCKDGSWALVSQMFVEMNQSCSSLTGLSFCLNVDMCVPRRRPRRAIVWLEMRSHGRPPLWEFPAPWRESWGWKSTKPVPERPGISSSCPGTQFDSFFTFGNFLLHFKPILKKKTQQQQQKTVLLDKNQSKKNKIAILAHKII